MKSFELFDQVRLTTNRFAAEGAPNGDIGTIIEIYHREGLPLGFEGAFTNPQTGVDYAMITVHEEDIELAEKHHV